MKYGLSEIRIMNKHGSISRIEITPIKNEGFYISIITDDKEEIKLNTQRGGLRIFRTLDSAFRTAEGFMHKDCKLIVSGKEI